MASNKIREEEEQFFIKTKRNYSFYHLFVCSYH